VQLPSGSHLVATHLQVGPDRNRLARSIRSPTMAQDAALGCVLSGVGSGATVTRGLHEMNEGARAMDFRFPSIDLPWARKTPLQQIQSDVQKKADKLALPKIRGEDISAVIDDTAKAVGEGVGVVASQVADTAGQLARDASKVSAKAGKRGRERGRELSRDLAAAGEEGIKTLASDLRALGNEIKSYRITREKPSSNMLPGVALLGGLGSGMAAMYFFDPDQGRRRRALFRDQMVKWSRIAQRNINGQLKDLQNRTMGMSHELRSAIDETTGRAAEARAMADETASGVTASPYQGMEGMQAHTLGSDIEMPSDIDMPEAREGQPDLSRRS
jgi:hypothetical protein